MKVRFSFILMALATCGMAQQPQCVWDAGGLSYTCSKAAADPVPATCRQVQNDATHVTCPLAGHTLPPLPPPPAAAPIPIATQPAFGDLSGTVAVTIPPSTTKWLPTEWFGAGAAWNRYGHPQIAGLLSYAKLISESGQVYSYNSMDITMRAKVGTPQTSVRSGMAVVLRQYGFMSVMAIGEAGVAVSDPGTSVGPQGVTNVAGAFAGGGGLFFRLGKTNYTASLTARVLKVAGQPNIEIYGIMFGRAGVP